MLTYDSDTIYYEEEVPEFEDTVTDLYLEPDDDEPFSYQEDSYTLLAVLDNGKMIWHHRSYIPGMGSDLYIETNEKEIAGKKITKEIEELLSIKSAYAH